MTPERAGQLAGRWRIIGVLAAVASLPVSATMDSMAAVPLLMLALFGLTEAADHYGYRRGYYAGERAGLFGQGGSG